MKRLLALVYWSTIVAVVGCGAPPIEPTATPRPSPTVAPRAVATPRSLPAFSGAGGGVLAFVSDRMGNQDIYLMNADGSQLWQLTMSTNQDAWVSWSPDGEHLAYQSGPSPAIDIRVMDILAGSSISESTVRRLTSGAVGRGSWEPAWSPDGTRIAYSAAQVNGSDIFVVNTDGTGRQRLTNNRAIDGAPAWSPDSREIAFFSDRDGNWEIYAMSADSSAVRRLTTEPAEDSTPAWSPDGAWIAFVSERDGNQEIYRMRPDGTDLTRLTDNTAGDYWPAWSPDGKRIAFASKRDSNDEIYVMDADGSNPMRLTDSSAEDWGPAWWPGRP